MLQRPLIIAPSSEVGARDAAIAVMNVLAMEYDLPLWTRSGGIIEPNPDVAQHYEEGFAHYLKTASSALKL